MRGFFQSKMSLKQNKRIGYAENTLMLSWELLWKGRKMIMIISRLRSWSCGEIVHNGGICIHTLKKSCRSFFWNWWKWWFTWFWCCISYLFLESYSLQFFFGIFFYQILFHPNWWRGIIGLQLRRVILGSNHAKDDFDFYIFTATDWKLCMPVFSWLVYKH